MKLSLLNDKLNLRLVLNYIYPVFGPSIIQWSPSCPEKHVEAIAYLISQLVLQSSIYLLVRKNNKMDVQHFGVTKALLVKIVVGEMEFIGGPGKSIAVTTSKQIKRYNSVGLAELVLINDIVYLFEKAGSGKSDKVTWMIYEQMKQAVSDASKFINKTDKFVVNDQLDLYAKNSNNAFI